MRQQIEDRLAELKAEYQQGQSRLNQLDQERARTAEVVLRISGAIQVCEELLTQPATEQEKQHAVTD